MKGLHLIHLNVNNQLPKINELRYIFKLSHAAGRGIIELKLDNCVFLTQKSKYITIKDFLVTETEKGERLLAI